jgi:hypothetical protein
LEIGERYWFDAEEEVRSEDFSGFVLFSIY